jgi:cytochrome c-type biogenesis protein CcmH/NrfG
MPNRQDVPTQLAVLVEQVATMREDLAELTRKVDGPPWERSVRGRLHALEGDASAARIASETLAEAQRERHRTERAAAEAKRARKVTGWKLLGATTAGIVALYPYLAHFNGWGS